MRDFDFEKMLFCIPKDKHSKEKIISILNEHDEIDFVSFVGIDMAGHDTDEKIPVKLFIHDMDELFENGVQTDGSSVALPKIADLNNAKVDLIPDMDVNWYVDYNYNYVDEKTARPEGTLRIPCFLKHNCVTEVGSRVVLKESINYFKNKIMELLRDNPYIFQHLNGVESYDEIESIGLTSATELEFWVKTPDDKADREELTTAQVMKEQYWKRTIGPVRTALEKTLIVMNQYGFGVEMGHKEVGGVKARMHSSGDYDHIMEQLEIDWKYADTLQAADNENQIKYIVRDIFAQYGLEVTFVAKPISGVAGNGEHTHMSVCAKLKNGKVVNLFAAKHPDKEFVSPIGFAALMGLLKNYEVVNPFVSSSTEAFRRLKPGFEAPVCVVTSLGHGVLDPSRNRTVLVGLIRDAKNPMATRFELRSPNPMSNTYLVLAAGYMAMLDGIEKALEAKKTSKDLEKSISKERGEEDFYLEKDRVYRSEENVFDAFNERERNQLFGKAPATVWECIREFDKSKDKLEIFKKGNVMPEIVLESYRALTVAQWITELDNRVLPEAMEIIRNCKKIHDDEATDYDAKNWEEIDKLRNYLGKSTMKEQSLLKKIDEALKTKKYSQASKLQKELSEKLNDLIAMYSNYKKNLF